MIGSGGRTDEGAAINRPAIQRITVDLDTHTITRCWKSVKPKPFGDFEFMRYLISYDLNKEGQDYASLTDELKKFGAKRVLYSQWVLRHNDTTCAALRDHFWKLMDSNDRLLVMELDGTGWAGMRLMIKLSEF